VLDVLKESSLACCAPTVATVVASAAVVAEASLVAYSCVKQLSASNAQLSVLLLCHIMQPPILRSAAVLLIATSD
jgi:hypothetical protein